MNGQSMKAALAAGRVRVAWEDAGGKVTRPGVSYEVQVGHRPGAVLEVAGSSTTKLSNERGEAKWYTFDARWQALRYALRERASRRLSCRRRTRSKNVGVECGGLHEKLAEQVDPGW